MTFEMVLAYPAIGSEINLLRAEGEERESEISQEVNIIVILRPVKCKQILGGEKGWRATMDQLSPSSFSRLFHIKSSAAR